MFADNDAAARAAFEQWMAQGPSAPSNADIVRHEKMDVELLHHLASFMFHAGRRSALPQSATEEPTS